MILMFKIIGKSGKFNAGRLPTDYVVSLRIIYIVNITNCRKSQSTEITKRSRFIAILWSIDHYMRSLARTRHWISKNRKSHVIGNRVQLQWRIAYITISICQKEETWDTLHICIAWNRYNPDIKEVRSLTSDVTPQSSKWEKLQECYIELFF